MGKCNCLHEGACCLQPIMCSAHDDDVSIKQTLIDTRSQLAVDIVTVKKTRQFPEFATPQLNDVFFGRFGAALLRHQVDPDLLACCKNGVLSCKFSACVVSSLVVQAGAYIWTTALFWQKWTTSIFFFEKNWTTCKF